MSKDTPLTAIGPVPFSSYMTTPAFLAREREVVRRFTRAVYRTQRWLAAHGAAEVARAIGPAFPAIDAALLERAVGRYLAQDTWSREPLLGRPGYDYLQQILLDGGFITSRQRYEDLVDTRAAREAMDTSAAR